MRNQKLKENSSKEEVIDILLNGQIELQGQFSLGSNYTFLVNLTHQSKTIKAVYKPMKGEVPLWDFPPESLAAREAAAFVVSEALRWNLVPPTTIRDGGPFGKGSLQLFIPHNPGLNYFSFDHDTRQCLRPSALFDMLINNADRKGSHIILDENNHIWLIDHGLCFNTISKMRTVIWDFCGEAIDKGIIAQLESLIDDLNPGTEISGKLAKLLTEEEIIALKNRILFIIKQPVFPAPEKDKRQFPWPLV